VETEPGPPTLLSDEIDAAFGQAVSLRRWIEMGSGEYDHSGANADWDHHLKAAWIQQAPATDPMP
jgi:hypothetical protein